MLISEEEVAGQPLKMSSGHPRLQGQSRVRTEEGTATRSLHVFRGRAGRCRRLLLKEETEKDAGHQLMRRYRRPTKELALDPH